MKNKIFKTSMIVMLLIAILGALTTYAVQTSKVKEHLNLGNKYLLEESYEQAVFEFEEVLAIDKKNVDARLGLSKAYIAIDKPRKAEKVLVDGIEITPEEEPLYGALADLYLMENKVENAISILDQGYSKTKDKALEEQLNKIKSQLEIIANRYQLQVDTSTDIKLIRKDENGKEHVVVADWNLSNEDIGTLSSQKGSSVSFNAKVLGKETIIAKVGSIEKSVDIEIKEDVLESIEILIESNKGKVGDKVEVKVVGKNQKGEETEIAVEPTWEIEGDIANIITTEGSTAVLSYVKNGNGKVIVKVGEITTSTNITVENITIEKKTYKVVTTVLGQGTITKNPYFKEYNENTNLKLQAVPKEGWKFHHWEGDLSGNTNPSKILIQKNKNIKAIFVKLDPVVQKQYTLKITTSGEGNVVRDIDNNTYKDGENVTLNALPKEGWKFDHWEGDLSGNTNPSKISMQNSKDIKAVFVPVQSGTVKNAVNGNGISNINVKFRKGENIRVGNIFKEIKTDVDGKYNMNNLPAGKYTIEVSGEGYVTTWQTVECISGKVNENQNVSITPVMTDAETRIVLEWGEKPSDLDAHLVGPSFHISYEVKSYEDYAILDHDDTNSYGPETITIKKQPQGKYIYRVHNFSEETDIKNSQAKVKVYTNNMLTKTYEVPTTGEGLYWNVFELDGNKINTINTISNINTGSDDK